MEPIVDNPGENRFELVVDGETAFLAYERTPTSLVLIHTEVPPALGGRHLGDALAKYGIDQARAEGRQLVVVCPFVRAFLRKHPELDAH
jgi:uncharacterized protein